MTKSSKRNRAALLSRACAAEFLEGRCLLSVGPLTAATPTVTYSGLTATVHYSIVDPVRNTTVTGTASYTGASNAGWGVSGLVSADGIVAWKFAVNYQDTSNGTNSALIGYAIYDPIAGAWKTGQKSYSGNTGPLGNQYSSSAPSITNGVISWSASFLGANSNTADGGWEELDWGTYDPSAGAWKFDSHTSNWSPPLGSVYPSLTASANDTVGWVEESYNGNSTDGAAVGYSIYDPNAHAWKDGGESYTWGALQAYYVISSPTISNQSVNYTVYYDQSNGQNISTTKHTKGYKVSNASWYEGPTLPYADFVASPLTGKTSLNVWYFDSSLGANSWSWSFGDGSAVSTSESGYHTYTKAGIDTLTGSVTGQTGTNAQSVTVTVGTSTTTSVTSSNSSSTYGDSITLTASITPSSGSNPSGTVQFKVDGSNFGSPVAVSSSAAKLVTSTIPAGSHSITAVYSGDTNFLSSTSSALSQSVSKATPTISWPTPPAIPYGTALGSTQLDATASVPGTFVYSPPAGTTITSPQLLSVTFTPTDTTDYNSASDSVTQSVNITTTSGTLTLPTVAGSGIHTENFSSISIAAGSKLVVSAPTSNANRLVIVTPSLTIAGSSGNWTGQIDLNGNDLIVTGGNISNVSSMVAEGYNHGAWNGADGITSSLAASDSTHSLSLGVFENDNGKGSAIFSTFDNQPVSDGDVLIKSTVIGDATLDGTTNALDFNALATNFGKPATFGQGDFDYSQTVNSGDFALLASKYGKVLAAPAGSEMPASSPTVAVPVTSLAAQPVANLFAKEPISTLSDVLK